MGKRIINLPDDVMDVLKLYKVKYGTKNINESISRIVRNALDADGTTSKMPWWCDECPQNGKMETE